MRDVGIMRKAVQVSRGSEYNGHSTMSSYLPDPAFKAIPANSTAFVIWRVEKLKLALLPKEKYGTFYDGDSYVIYAASETGHPAGMDMKPHETTKGLEVHIHFWLGNNTSIDEQGVATIKTVELDSYLGGSPIQSREVQGNESSRFKGYFPSGLRILSGGVESGFNEVTDVFEPRLYRVKGRKNPTVTQMPSVAWEHFNSGDTFILDTKDVVFVWNGQTTSHGEKVQAARTSQRMKAEHNAGAIIFIEDGHEKDLPKSELQCFEQFLKLSERKVKTAEEAGEDEAAESITRTTVKLYQCSDEDGTFKVTEVKSGPLLQTDLSSNDSFIVDNGAAGIWVWIGKKASAQERADGMRNGYGFVTKKGYPDSTRVTKVIDGGEPTEFRLLFSKWHDKNQTQGMGNTNTVGNVTNTVNGKFDASTMHDNPSVAAEAQMVDDGTGKKQLWRLENFELVPVAEKFIGLFFAGDTYLIQYTYESGGSEKHILYYWLGDHCAIDERGAIAMRTVEKDTQMGGVAMQVRVVQNKEPAHFLAMFGGHMVILKGGKASSFDGEGAKDTELPKQFLLQVRGNNARTTRAVEVDLKASSLNSNDVFILNSPGENYVWYGKGANGDEREMAKGVATIVFFTDYSVVMEGQEKENFWRDIGGKMEYANSIELAQPEDKLPPRLFQCSNASGSFKGEEIINFVQTDMASEDVFLLDARETIFIWIGNDSNDVERKSAIETAIQYLKTDPTKRDPDTPIIQIKQGFEPPTFTGFFGIWDNDIWKDRQSFNEFQRDIISDNNPVVIDPKQSQESVSFDDAFKMPLAELRLPNDCLPDTIDKGHKEHHLTHEDFRTVFGMEYPAFAILPPWKQINLKKAAQLF